MSWRVSLVTALESAGWDVAIGDDGILCERAGLVYVAPVSWPGVDDEDDGIAVAWVVAAALGRASMDGRIGLVRVAVTSGPHGWSATVLP